MFNIIRKSIIIILVLSTVLSIRQSDMGTNDWSIQNIGKITELNFASFNAQSDDKSVRQFKNVFYLSQLGIFGLLNRRSGEIANRQQLAANERIIQSDQKELIVLTQNGQILRYNKLTMQRTVDNRLSHKQYKNIHSYVKANNKIYVGDDKVIRQMATLFKSIEQISSIEAPSGSIYMKIFASTKGETSILHALNYYPSKSQVCISEISQGGLIQKNCMNASLSPVSLYTKVFQNTGNIYFGDQNEHYYINYINFDSQKFNSKPVSFAHYGVKFQNGLTFTTKGIVDEKIIMVQSNRYDKIIYGELTNGHLYVHLGSEVEIGDRVATVCLEGKQAKVARVWANFLSVNQVEVYIQFQDLQISLYTQQNHPKQHKQLWHRQQSLAYIQKVLFMKYEGYQDHLNNAYHRKMDDQHYTQLSLVSKIQQIPLNFVARIKSQFQDVYNSVVDSVKAVAGVFLDTEKLAEVVDVRGYLKSTMSSDMQKKYGLRKYIIVITSYNTMFAIDTKTSQIIWKYSSHKHRKKQSQEDQKLITLIKLKQEYQKQIAIAITYKYHITYITQIHEDGTFTQLADYQTAQQPTIHKISPHSIIIRSDHKVYRYDLNKELQGVEKQYGFYQVGEGKIVGWKVEGEELVKTWVFQTPNNQSMLTTSPCYRGQPESRLPLINQKKVLFKNVDFSNIAILTIQSQKSSSPQSQKPSQRLHLYIINGLTGTIQFHEYQTGINSKLPINLVYDQNNAIVSYYNLRNRVYQIWSVEAFQAPLQSQLISKKYVPSFQRQDIIFRTKVYGTVLPIKHLFISQSKQALLKRNILLTTRQNKIYSLPREFISTRRPKTAEAESAQNLAQAEFITSKYPPQQYILPVNTLGFLTYNKKLSDIDHMRFSSSDLESTIFIMAYGIDVFLLRTAPDRAFDMLADGFNYLQLVVVVVAVTFAAIFFRNKAKQAKLKKSHLD